jgi:hypothetical protein
MTRAITACAVLWLFACSKGNAATLEPSALASAAVSASPAPKPMPDASAGKPFGAPCVADSECAGAVCFHKRLKGPDAGKERRGADEAVEHDGYCSLKCNDDADCPVPPTKGRCGARGMCKRPD